LAQTLAFAMRMQPALMQRKIVKGQVSFGFNTSNMAALH
jgi:hypothetical protein